MSDLKETVSISNSGEGSQVRMCEIGLAEARTKEKT